MDWLGLTGIYRQELKERLSRGNAKDLNADLSQSKLNLNNIKYIYLLNN